MIWVSRPYNLVFCISTDPNSPSLEMGESKLWSHLQYFLKTAIHYSTCFYEPHFNCLTPMEMSFHVAVIFTSTLYNHVFIFSKKYSQYSKWLVYYQSNQNTNSFLFETNDQPIQRAWMWQPEEEPPSMTSSRTRPNNQRWIPFLKILKPCCRSCILIISESYVKPIPCLRSLCVSRYCIIVILQTKVEQILQRNGRWLRRSLALSRPPPKKYHKLFFSI